MKTFKVIGNISFIFLSVIALCVCLGYMYYHYFVKGITQGFNNINDSEALDAKKEEDMTEGEKDEYEKRVLFTANYFSNAKGNGIELQELNIKYFAGLDLTKDEYRETGMQFIGNFETYSKLASSEEQANERILNEFTYYDSVNGVSYNGGKGQGGGFGTILNRNQMINVKIDNRVFAMNLDGGFTTGWWLWEVTHLFNYGDVFDCVFQSIKSNSNGYGDYYITLDLTKYFSLLEYDLTTGEFKEDKITSIIKNYAVLKFHYDENGARNSTQSLFKSIDCDPKYDLDEDNINTEYWQERAKYIITENTNLNGKPIFNYRYSEIYKGHFLSLTMDGKKLFAEMPRTKVTIKINLDSIYFKINNLNIIGIDYNAFENFELDTFEMTGSGQIEVLEKAFYKTKLKILKRSRDLTFNFLNGSIDEGFSEVIV